MDVSNLLKRIEIFMVDGSYDQAIEYCEKVLDIDVGISLPYLYKILCLNKVSSVSELGDLDIYNNMFYKRFVEFDDGSNLLKFEEDYFLPRYNVILEMIEKDASILEIIKKLELIINYKNCLELRDKYLNIYNENILEEKYNKALVLFEIGDITSINEGLLLIENLVYKDCLELISKYSLIVLELEKQEKYEKALSLIDNNPMIAYELFLELDDYLDSLKYVDECFLKVSVYKAKKEKINKGIKIIMITLIILSLVTYIVYTITSKISIYNSEKSYIEQYNEEKSRGLND